MQVKTILLLLSLGVQSSLQAAITGRDDVGAPLIKEGGPKCEDIDEKAPKWFFAPVCALVRRDPKLVTSLIKDSEQKNPVAEAEVTLREVTRDLQIKDGSSENIKFVDIKEGVASRKVEKAWWPSALLKAALNQNIDPKNGDAATAVAMLTGMKPEIFEPKDGQQAIDKIKELKDKSPLLLARFKIVSSFQNQQPISSVVKVRDDGVTFSHSFGKEWDAPFDSPSWTDVDQIVHIEELPVL